MIEGDGMRGGGERIVYNFVLSDSFHEIYKVCFQCIVEFPILIP